METKQLQNKSFILYFNQGNYDANDADDDINPNIEFKELDNHTYRTSITIPNVLNKFIIGFKGATKKRIESETNTRISVPQRAEGDVSTYRSLFFIFLENQFSNETQRLLRLNTHGVIINIHLDGQIFSLASLQRPFTVWANSWSCHCRWLVAEPAVPSYIGTCRTSELNFGLWQ